MAGGARPRFADLVGQFKGRHRVQGRVQEQLVDVAAY